MYYTAFFRCVLSLGLQKLKDFTWTNETHTCVEKVGVGYEEADLEETKCHVMRG